MSSSVEFEKSLKNICKQLTKNEEKYDLVLSEENYPKLQNLLKKNGMTFIVRHSDYHGEEKRRILWSSVIVPYFKTPFYISKTSSMQCSNGPKYYPNKPKRSSTIPVLQQNNSMGNSEPKAAGNIRSRKRQPSKKVGCNATMKVIVIKTYPEHCTKKNNDSKYEKSVIMKRLKEELKSNPAAVVTETIYHISFSTAAVHCHSVWTSFTVQRLDPALKNEIRNLVESGITNIPTIKILLCKWVKENIGDVNDSARAYWPTKKTIRNHVMKYTNASHVSMQKEKVGLKIKTTQRKKKTIEKKNDCQSYSIAIESSSSNPPENEVDNSNPEIIEIECVDNDYRFELNYTPTEIFHSTERSLSGSKIRELVEIIYDRSFLLPDDCFDSALYDKLQDVLHLMNDHIDRNRGGVTSQS